MNTMRFCSFDQDNNLNQILKTKAHVLQAEAVEQQARPTSECSQGHEDEAKLRESIYYTVPSMHKPPVVQLRRGSRHKNNRYKGCSSNETGALAQPNQSSMVVSGASKKDGTSS